SFVYNHRTYNSHQILPSTSSLMILKCSYMRDDSAIFRETSCNPNSIIMFNGARCQQCFLPSVALIPTFLLHAHWKYTRSTTSGRSEDEAIVQKVPVSTNVCRARTT